jgi:hypothetical protein
MTIATTRPQTDATIRRMSHGAYEFVTFTGKDAMTSGRSQTIVSPSFPGLKVTAIEVLKAGRR